MGQDKFSNLIKYICCGATFVIAINSTPMCLKCLEHHEDHKPESNYPVEFTSMQNMDYVVAVSGGSTTAHLRISEAQSWGNQKSL